MILQYFTLVVTGVLFVGTFFFVGKGAYSIYCLHKWYPSNPEGYKGWERWWAWFPVRVTFGSKTRWRWGCYLMRYYPLSVIDPADQWVGIKSNFVHEWRWKRPWYKGGHRLFVYRELFDHMLKENHNALPSGR